MAPEVSPPPKAVKRTISPRFIFPLSTVSLKAIGMDAEDVFPVCSRLMMNFSIFDNVKFENLKKDFSKK
jgi:hypothetical protein